LAQGGSSRKHRASWASLTILPAHRRKGTQSSPGKSRLRPDGREEWLEFWSHHHLLPPFAELHAGREECEDGGRVLAFLSLPDLIRSKEIERERD
jgi:hypothetical protein